MFLSCFSLNEKEREGKKKKKTEENNSALSACISHPNLREPRPMLACCCDDSENLQNFYSTTTKTTTTTRITAIAWLLVLLLVLIAFSWSQDILDWHHSFETKDLNSISSCPLKLVLLWIPMYHDINTMQAIKLSKKNHDQRYSSRLSIWDV